MSDGISSISQSFEVEWLNTTLKFVKNDNHMIMGFPEMPLSHLLCLHNLIWQHKNNVGLGLKSLYAPLWEAMRIFSFKYRFIVCVMKSIDNKGQLIIEKIKKTDQGADIAPSNNEETVADIKNVSQPRPDKETKSQKYYKDKSKIIESISSTFLRATLQKILDFINDKKAASLVFMNLAPIEAKFLENFPGIYKRRKVFENMMSPACNDIFNEMPKCFIYFDKICKLEVYPSKTNVKTKNRKITFLKVPSYARPKMTRATLTQTVNKTVIENPSTANKTDVNPRDKLLKALSVNMALSNMMKIYSKKSIMFEKSSESETNSPVREQETNSETEKKGRERKKDGNSRKDKLLEAMSTPLESDIGLRVLQTDFGHGDQSQERLANCAGDVLVHKCVRKNRKIYSKKSIMFEKSSESETSSPVREQETNSETEKKGRERKKDGNSRKDKLLEAMSTPLESDIGLRMMQLMGWQGGALGRRGNGITEPIIPMLHLVQGAGLGHVTDESIKQAKVDFIIDILERILDFIDNDVTDTGINYETKISKKNKWFLKTSLMSFNNRKHVSLPNDLESDLGKNILDKMMKECNLFIDIKISSNNKEITLKKLFTDNSDKNKLKNNIKVLTTNTLEDDNNLNSNRIKLPEKKIDFKVLIWSKVLELLKSEDQFIEIEFDSALLPRHRDCVQNLCSKINRKQKHCGKFVKVFSEDINEKLGDTHLKLEYGVNNMSLIVRKMYYENRFTNSAANNLNTTNVNSKENVRSSRPISATAANLKRD